MPQRTAGTIVLLLLMMGIAQAQSPLRISGNYRNTPLSEVFADLGDRYGLSFNYATERVAGHRATARFQETPLDRALEQLLAPLPFRYMITGGTTVIIIPDPKKDLVPPPKPATTVRGTVADAATGEPLPYAAIAIKSTNRGTASNTEGFFALPGLEGDSVELEISYLGYQPITLKVADITELSGMEISLVRQPEIRLDTLLSLLAPPQSAIALQVPAGQARLDPQKINALPNLGQPDVFQALQLMPGISATTGTSANLQIRGGTADQNLILLNDIPLYHLDHFYGIFSAVNPLAVQSLQVHKGGFPATYGGRSAAVVDMTGRLGNRNEPEFNVNLNLLSANVAMDVPIRRNLVWTFTGRLAYDDVLKTPLYHRLSNSYRTNRLDEDEEWLDFSDPSLEWSPDFDFYDISSQLIWYASEKDVLSASLFAGGDVLKVDINSEVLQPEVTNYRYRFQQASDWSNNGLSLKWGRQWNSKWYSKVLASYSGYLNNTTYQETYARALGQTGFFVEVENRERLLENTLTEGQYKALVRYQPSTAHQWEWGVELNGISTYFATRDNGELQSEIPTTGGRFSWYAEDNWAVSPSTNLQLGLRRTRYTPGDSLFAFWEPRVAIEQKLSPDITLKAAAGTYRQFINQFSRDRFNTSNRFLWVMADGDQSPMQRSRQVLAGLQWRAPGDQWTVDVEAYVRNTLGIKEYFAFRTSAESDWIEVYPEGTSYARGLDVTVHKREGNYRGWLSYSLGRVTQQLNALINLQTVYPARQDQRHEINLVHLYSLRKWNFSSTWVYGSGRPYTPTGPEGSRREVFDFLRVNSERLPSYARMDVAAQYGFESKRWSGNVGVSVYNLFNRKNLQSRNYGYVLGEFPDDYNEATDPLPWEVRAFDVKMLGFTPNLFVNLKF